MNFLLVIVSASIVNAVPKIENESNSSDLIELMAELRRTAQETGIACPGDVLFVLDATDSMRNVFKQCLVYITNVILGLTISPTDDRVGVILYSSSIRKKEKIKLGSINDAVKLIKAIEALPFLSGITSTGAALKLAADALKARRPNVSTSVVVMTDGFSYDGVDENAMILRRMPNVSVYTVSVGDIFVRKELEAIAGSPSNTLFGPTSYGELVTLIKKCNGQPKKQVKVETATELYTRTVTDSHGRHLIPIPHTGKILDEKTRGNLGRSGWDDPRYLEDGGVSKQSGTEGTGIYIDQQHSLPRRLSIYSIRLIMRIKRNETLKPSPQLRTAGTTLSLCSMRLDQ
ncbi:hypothetical protein KIN20_003938 [Parelaphostrongylus tenuis]|uniref:VWFA domain-containing protein n=1 Tax=Parelaphostrongylus tenuis TaxID=148309 RepID=A0AAD5LY30_PARTN|nr:hypothetical protein KIN20_003938 [Parelaphostrongylus tenuis]